MSSYTTMIIVGLVVGIITRLALLSTDYRQYPTYPHELRPGTMIVVKH